MVNDCDGVIDEPDAIDSLLRYADGDQMATEIPIKVSMHVINLMAMSQMAVIAMTQVSSNRVTECVMARQ